MLVCDVAIAAPSLTVSLPLASVEPMTEQSGRLSASCSDSGSLLHSSLHGASVTASCSKSSSIDTQSARDNVDTGRPQTLAECQEVIRRLEADSVKQAREVIMSSLC